MAGEPWWRCERCGGPGLTQAGGYGGTELVIGIVVLDLGAQGLHISTQSAIYALSASAHSRLTTAYIVAYFIAGVALSALTSAA